jgi:hypothetical protein
MAYLLVLSNIDVDKACSIGSGSCLIASEKIDSIARAQNLSTIPENLATFHQRLEDYLDDLHYVLMHLFN